MSYGPTQEQRDLIEMFRGRAPSFRRPSYLDRERNDNGGIGMGYGFVPPEMVAALVSLHKLDVKVRKLHPDAVIPQYATAGSAGFDLVAVEDVIIAPGETKKVPLGLAFEIPEGYEIQVRPRSGMSAKTKLRISNSPGTIDADFRGEACVLIDNITQDEYEIETEYDDELDRHYYSLGKVYEPCMLAIDGAEIPEKRGWTEHPQGTYTIRKGDRIAQGVLAKVPRAAFVEVAELGETERGVGGFGSSGIRAEVSE